MPAPAGDPALQVPGLLHVARARVPRVHPQVPGHAVRGGTHEPDGGVRRAQRGSYLGRAAVSREGLVECHVCVSSLSFSSCMIPHPPLGWTPYRPEPPLGQIPPFQARNPGALYSKPAKTCLFNITTAKEADHPQGKRFQMETEDFSSFEQQHQR